MTSADQLSGAHALQQGDAQHIWHPYTQHSLAAAPIPVRSASGAYLHTSDGRALLDCISSWWVTLHGHSHPVIAAAIAEQAKSLEQVIFAGFTHEPAVRLAEELVKILPPGLTRVFYSDNGSTAVEVAIKMALQYWRNRGEERNTIVALEGAYHGDTFGAMSVSARGLFTDPFARLLFEVERLGDPVDHNPAQAFGELVRRRRGEVAAIIVEPLLLGAGGMRIWSDARLRQLREIASEEGVLFIADEVLTGFGRTGPLFACEHAAISPDIICLSKGLTGGFLPLGATVATEELFEAFLGDRRRTLFHGHSFTANPISCAAAIASIGLLDENCAERRRGITSAHHRNLTALASLPGVRRARSIGTIAAFDLEGEEGYLSDAAVELARGALDSGILVRPLGNVVYLLPPYCIEEAELDRVYAVLSDQIALLARRKTR